MNDRAGGRVPELDGLRGLAIALVILCHYVANAEHRALGVWPHRALTGLSFGWSGVDLFFVLSGFLIGRILLESREAPHYFRTFYMRRVHRILPVYYLWILLFGGLVVWGLWVAPGSLAVTHADLAQVPVHLLFLQNLHAGLPAFSWMWLVVMWSLAVEEQFYLLAPPLIRWMSLRGVTVVLLCAVATAPFLRAVVFGYLSPGTYLSTFLMPCRADALAMGVLLAIGWRSAKFRAWVGERQRLLAGILVVLALSFAGLSWWFAHPLSMVTVTIGYTWLGLFYSCLLLTVMSRKNGWIAGVARWGWLGRLGKISYCVYLIHLTVNVVAHRLILHGEPEIVNWRGVGVTLLALVASLVIASASWKYFEEPLVKRGHSYAYWDRADAGVSREAA